MKRFLKILKRIAIGLLLLILLLSLVTFIYMQHPKFGKTPSGERLSLIEQSPHYKNGRFRNLVEKPTIAEGYSMWGQMYKMLFKRNKRIRPSGPIPSIKTDLLTLPPDTNLAVWFGHSSLYLQVNGKKILIDPVFSGNASPIPGSVKAFEGTDIYTVADLPQIDYLLISHDHYDHLDYTTILELRSKVKHVICGLGVGAHFEYWGYAPEQLIEKDWGGTVALDSALTIYTETAHHDSGRGFKRGQSLWLSFYIQSPGLNIFYSGDGGYDTHFSAIGKKFGPPDWAIIENGQYNRAWHSVHLLPEETLQAAKDVGARHLIPVHNSKFALAMHDWDEPLVQLSEHNKTYQIPLATARIGEVIYLNSQTQTFSEWWKEVK